MELAWKLQPESNPAKTQGVSGWRRPDGFGALSAAPSLVNMSNSQRTCPAPNAPTGVRATPLFPPDFFYGLRVQDPLVGLRPRGGDCLTRSVTSVVSAVANDKTITFYKNTIYNSPEAREMRPEIQLQRDTIATVTRYNCNRIHGYRYQTPLGYNEIQLQPDTTATDTTATGYNCNTGGFFCHRIQCNEIQLGLFGGSGCHRIQQKLQPDTAATDTIATGYSSKK